jgi:hypothetical protein
LLGAAADDIALVPEASFGSESDPSAHATASAKVAV